MNFDRLILYWIQQNMRCGFLDTVMPMITFLGDVGLIWILISLYLLLSKKYRRSSYILMTALIIGFLFGNLFLKNLIARPRPFITDPSVTLLITAPKDFSFPSGHTLASAIGATVLTITDRKFGKYVIPLAILIGFSRMYLYVHYPTDVLAGAVLGVLIGAITCRISESPFLQNRNLRIHHS